MTHRLTSIMIALALLLASAASAQAQAWPNEPSGGTVLTDQSFSCLVCNGWIAEGSSLTTDATAPLSPSSVMQQRFGPGLVGGTSPGYAAFPIGAPKRELYFAFKWKPSSNWTGSPMGGGQKISFMIPQSDWLMVMLLTPQKKITAYFSNWGGVSNCSLPGYGDCPGTRIVYANVNNPTITMGEWHTIEYYIKVSTSTTSQDGILRWWIDGQLAANFTNVNYPQYGIVEAKLDATWGENGDVKSDTTYFWFDHVRVVAGGTSSGGGGTSPPPPPPPPPSPPSPPNAPTLLRRLP